MQNYNNNINVQIIHAVFGMKKPTIHLIQSYSRLYMRQWFIIYIK